MRPTEPRRWTERLALTRVGGRDHSHGRQPSMSTMEWRQEWIKRMECCFKCLRSDDDLVGFVGRDGAGQRYKSAPYLRAKLYLCPACIKPKPKRDRYMSFACGCTEDRVAPVGAKHWLPPNPDCAVYSRADERANGGRMRDRHHFVRIKKRIGATGEAGREGHHFVESDDSILETFANGAWHTRTRDFAEPTGRRPGRPRVVQSVEVHQIYLVDVAKEVVHEFSSFLETALLGSRNDVLLALDAVGNISWAELFRHLSGVEQESADEAGEAAA
jgi:hypothetical protein